MREFLALFLVCLAAVAAPSAIFAQTVPPDSKKELVVGTKDAPPFAMKAADGTWQGISIDLWRKIANEKQYRYRIEEEQTVQGLIDGVTNGKYDVAVAALTVTGPREQVLDFTPSFFATGLGIAVLAGGAPSWAPVITSLTSFSFAQAVLALIGLALAVGLVVWLFERRHNEDFGGGVARGLSSSVWWTTVAMTQRGAASFGPRTMPGRAVAILWMVGSIIAIAVFTAGITSALTIRQLQGSVHSVADLSIVRVGAIAGTSGETTLSQLRVKAEPFANVRDGLIALRRGKIDALVYDKPLLAWAVNHEFRSTIQLLDSTFDPQHYAFAVPANSPLRKPVGIALLDAIHNKWWDDTLFRYLGYR